MEKGKMFNAIMAVLGLKQGEKFLIRSLIGGVHTDTYRIEGGHLLNEGSVEIDEYFIKLCSGEFKVITAKDVCKRIGVEIGEEFLRTETDDKYRITENGNVQYWYRFTNQWEESDVFSLFDCYVNFKQFSLLPFEPMSDEIYYTYTYRDFRVQAFAWTGVAIDYFRKATGCIFRTKEEAIKARSAKYKELTGEDFSSFN